MVLTPCGLWPLSTKASLLPGLSALFLHTQPDGVPPGHIRGGVRLVWTCCPCRGVSRGCRPAAHNLGDITAHVIEAVPTRGVRRPQVTSLLEVFPCFTVAHPIGRLADFDLYSQLRKQILRQFCRFILGGREAGNPLRGWGAL